MEEDNESADYKSPAKEQKISRKKTNSYNVDNYILRQHRLMLL